MKRPTSVCAALNALPPEVHTHDLTFVLGIFDNYSSPDNLDIRLCYELDEKSWAQHPAPAGLLGEPGSWFNPFNAGRQQSFLYLVERIQTDEELIAALLKIRAWLLEKGIIHAAQYPAFK